MSRKTKTIATQEKAKLVLVPKLRFPEFWGAEGWMLSVLVRACEMQAGKFVAASNISEHNQNGFFPCFGGNGLRGYTTTHTHDGTYPLIGRQGALCGNVRLVSGKFHATEHAVAATPKNAIDVGWLYYSLDLLNLNRFATGQAQPGLSVDVLENVSLAIPPLEAEQQKIADCLSSVDELIAAQALKVEALKTHKKGLMQQLFPREGETQPRLRFPEFQNAGEWVSKPLGALGEIITGKTPSTKEADLWGGDILFITPTDISEDSKYQHTATRTVVKTKSIKVLPEGSIVYTCIASIGKMALTVSPSITNQQINAVVPKRRALGEFLYYVLVNLTRWIKTIPATNTLPIINKTDFSKIAILHPEDKEEQKRIASCLSSHDDLITAEIQKFETLKTHKKGLMQQLFPEAEGVDA